MRLYVAIFYWVVLTTTIWCWLANWNPALIISMISILIENILNNSSKSLPKPNFTYKRMSSKLSWLVSHVICFTINMLHLNRINWLQISLTILQNAHNFIIVIFCMCNGGAAKITQSHSISTSFHCSWIARSILARSADASVWIVEVAYWNIQPTPQHSALCLFWTLLQFP